MKDKSAAENTGKFKGVVRSRNLVWRLQRYCEWCELFEMFFEPWWSMCGNSSVPVGRGAAVSDHVQHNNENQTYSWYWEMSPRSHYHHHEQLRFFVFILKTHLVFPFSFSLPRRRRPLGWNWKADSGRSPSTLATCFLHHWPCRKPLNQAGIS